MTTIDPAGAASGALYTPAAPVPTPTETVTERPVVESNEAERTNDAATQAKGNDSNLGRHIDTTA